MKFLSGKTLDQVKRRIADFNPRYSTHWMAWYRLNPDDAEAKAAALRSTLGSWQAFRGKGRKAAPTQEIAAVLDKARPALAALAEKDVRCLRETRSDSQGRAYLAALWELSAGIYQDPKNAPLVGRSKAIMLLTNGMFGPAFDRDVCTALFGGNFPPLTPCGIWLAMLTEVAHDIAAFERERNVRLEELVPGTAVGRIYDMAAGPGDRQDQN